MTRDEISLEELLHLSPEALLAGGLRRPEGADEGGVLADDLRGTGALALGEQLRHDGVPVDALALCLVALDRAREAAAGVTPRLRGDLAMQVDGLPTLARWMDAIVARVAAPADVDAAVELLGRAINIWKLNEALRAAPEGAPR